VKNTFRILFLISLLYTFCGYSGTDAGDEGLRQDSYTIFKALYSFRFRTADSLIKETKRNYPDRAISYLLSVNYYWWLIISGEDNFENRKAFYLDLNLAQQKAGAAKKNMSNEDIYTFINIYSYKARIEGLNKNYIKAVSHTNACVDYLKKSFGKEKEYEYFYLTSGLYNYYITNADEEYPILKPYLLLYPKGDLKTGIEYLLIASRSTDFALNTEANYFLTKIYLEQKNYETANIYCRLLGKKYPANLLYKYYLFKGYLDNNEKEKALDILKQINVQSILNEQLTTKQKDHFINLAQKKLEKYYEKNPGGK
jgi:hypothetical protein